MSKRFLLTSGQDTRCERAEDVHKPTKWKRRNRKHFAQPPSYNEDTFQAISIWGRSYPLFSLGTEFLVTLLE